MGFRTIPSYVEVNIFLSNGAPLSSVSTSLRHSSKPTAGKPVMDGLSFMLAFQSFDEHVVTAAIEGDEQLFAAPIGPRARARRDGRCNHRSRSGRSWGRGRFGLEQRLDLL